MVGDDRNLNDYEIDNEDDLVIIPKMKMPTESSMATSAGKIVRDEVDRFVQTDQ